MRPGLVIAIVISIVAILLAVLLRFAFIVPYCEITVGLVERREVPHGRQVSYSLRYRASANSEMCNVVYRDGVPKESGSGSKSWSTNAIGAALSNLRGKGGGSSSSITAVDGRDVVVPIGIGDARRLAAGDELVLIEYRDADGVRVKHALRFYALGYDGERLPVP